MDGLEGNFQKMQELYGQQWILRLYYQLKPDSESLKKICSLACFRSNIELCDVSDVDSFDFSSIGNETVVIGITELNYGSLSGHCRPFLTKVQKSF